VVKTKSSREAGRPVANPARLKPRLRVTSGGEVLLGPGMAELLDAIRKTGSLRLAADGMAMSYMHAWGLVRTMNRGFREPLVTLARGGAGHGGARLTDLGAEVLSLYREMESAALRAANGPWRRLRRLLS
jgi:molybdate transport system regulatory protein